MRRAKKWCGIALVFLALGPVSLHAGAYDLKEITPPVKEAFAHRHDRYNQLKELKAQGAIGETHHGYVHMLKPSDDTKAIVDAENRDRGIIYRAILAQHELGAQGLASVEITFGDVQRDKAAPGEFVQLPSGEWVKKQS